MTKSILKKLIQEERELIDKAKGKKYELHKFFDQKSKIEKVSETSQKMEGLWDFKLKL